jgi:hypothetical protein
LRESTSRSTYRIAEAYAFRAAVLAGIGKALNACGTPPTQH